jgi:serine/threonine-protein kinase 24/25/MST4
VITNQIRIHSYLVYRDELDDTDDLWDFGTVRHVGKQSTIGRAGPTENGTSANVLTYPPRHEISESGSSGDGSTVYAHGVNGYSSSSSTKLDLPPTPNHARSGPSPTSPTAGNVHKALPINPRASEDEGTLRGGRRDPSTGSEDSDDDLRADMQRASLSSPVAPTMLDSVVLPAIGSVSISSPDIG